MDGAAALEYSTDRRPSAAEYADLLRRSTLAERRPLEIPGAAEAMVQHAGLFVTCWADGLLVGAARSFTDYVHCCYLADLAVDEAMQRRGIGRELIRLTQQQLQPSCRIILLAAPKATEYYPHIGFTQHPSAWTLI